MTDNWFEHGKQEQPPQNETPDTKTQGTSHAEEVQASHAARIGGSNILRFYPKEGAYAITRSYIDGYDLNELENEITIHSARAVVVIKGKGMETLWRALTHETIDDVTLGEIWEGVTVKAITIYRAGDKPPPINLDRG